MSNRVWIGDGTGRLGAIVAVPVSCSPWPAAMLWPVAGGPRGAARSLRRPRSKTLILRLRWHYVATHHMLGGWSLGDSNP